MYDKTAMNAWASARYDELMREGKHGHYESMFRVIHEAIERASGGSGCQCPMCIRLRGEQVESSGASEVQSAFQTLGVVLEKFAKPVESSGCSGAVGVVGYENVPALAYATSESGGVVPATRRLTVHLFKPLADGTPLYLHPPAPAEGMAADVVREALTDARTTLGRALCLVGHNSPNEAEIKDVRKKISQALKFLAAAPSPLAAKAEPSAEAVDVERLIRTVLPGGSVCDPQRVADSIRAYFDGFPHADTALDSRKERAVQQEEIESLRAKLAASPVPPKVGT